MDSDASLLSTAIVVWTGWGKRPWPSRDQALLIDRFGASAAEILLPQIRRLEQEFYASDARYFAADLVSMGEAAGAEFRRNHPEISEEAIEALAWCYTYDYK